MKHAVEHDLEPTIVRQVTRLALESYVARYGKYQPQVEWPNEDKAVIEFHVKGMRLEGQLDLRPGRVEMDVAVPLLLRAFKGEAIRVIDREIRAWIEKHRNGEIDLPAPPE